MLNADQRNSLKKIVAFMGVGVLLAIAQFAVSLIADYHFERDYLQLWALADKSSTIAAKQKYIAQFVAALQSGYERGEFNPHNAIWMKTPNNSFTQNLNALKSLDDRLGQIQKLNPNSFEYNTAIQQITAQEQGEASHLIYVFEGCYKIANYPMVWQWIGGLFIAIETVMVFIGLYFMAELTL